VILGRNCLKKGCIARGKSERKKEKRTDKGTLEVKRVPKMQTQKECTGVKTGI
jgi:hypothetical protein